jgi:carbonic anhydrase
MEEALPIVLVVGLLVLIGGIVALVFYFEKKRSEKLQAVATSMGFTFTRKPTGGAVPGLPGFKLFNQGHSRKAYNLMQGATGDTEVMLFDYRYTIGHGKNSHTYNQTVGLFRSTDMMLPSFMLSPENVLHKIISTFGYQDIDFEENPDFSKSYLLRGPDEDAIRQTFAKDVLAFFANHKKLSVEAGGNAILIYRASRRESPDNIRAALEHWFSAFSLLRPKA